MSELNQQQRTDIVRYRMENARNTLSEVEFQINNGFYNTAVNRMYYACYYAVCALLIANKIQTKSHDGARQMFSLHFVKTGMNTEGFTATCLRNALRETMKTFSTTTWHRARSFTRWSRGLLPHCSVWGKSGLRITK